MNNIYDQYYREDGLCRQCRGKSEGHKMDCSYKLQTPRTLKTSLNIIVNKIKLNYERRDFF